MAKQGWRVVGRSDTDQCCVCEKPAAIVKYDDGRVRVSGICLSPECDRAMWAATARGMSVHNN